MRSDKTILGELMAVIEDRNRQRPVGSYTARLLDGGVDAIGAKICEEATELVEAARVTHEDSGKAVVHEAADLLYHVLVLLAHRDLALADVEAELARRFGVSGLDEKLSRPRRPSQG